MNVQVCDCFAFEAEPQFQVSICGSMDGVFAKGVTITEAFHNARYEALQHKLSLRSVRMVVTRLSDGRVVFEVNSAGMKPFQASLRKYLAEIDVCTERP